MVKGNVWRERVLIEQRRRTVRKRRRKEKGEGEGLTINGGAGILKERECVCLDLEGFVF